MKILFCSPCSLQPHLGAARMLMDLAGALERLGWRPTLMGPEDLGATSTDYGQKLYAYLRAHHREFDVVDFDYKYLTFRRSDFSEQVLMVARAQLLRHHHLNSPLPPVSGLRSALDLLRYQRYRRQQRRLLPINDATFREADLVSVLNRHAKDELVGRGVPAERIVVLPNGLSEEQRRRFEAVPVEPPAQPVVAFIGAFGHRKGASDMPAIFRRVAAAVPAVRFRLLGTQGGRYETAEDVRRHFPPSLRPHVEVIPRYAPDDLPGLLAACSVGVFPSYAEGFPLGVLEMMAAALPVVAYDAPGAPEMVPSRFVVPLRDTSAMADRLIALLRDRDALAAARAEARDLARTFRWPDIAARTDALYRDHLARRRSGLLAGGVG